jgi:hypothetical protein
MKNKIVKFWDDFIYGQAYHTIKRMAARNSGIPYLLELHIRKWNELNPIPESLKKATEDFFNAMEEHSDKK